MPWIYFGNWWPTLDPDEETGGKEWVWNFRGSSSEMCAFQWCARSFQVRVSGSLRAGNQPGSTDYHDRTITFEETFTIQDAGRGPEVVSTDDLIPDEADPNRVFIGGGSFEPTLINGTDQIPLIESDIGDPDPDREPTTTSDFSVSIELQWGEFTEESLSPSHYLGVGAIGGGAYAIPLHAKITATGLVNKYATAGVQSTTKAYHTEASTQWREVSFVPEVTEPDFSGPEVGSVVVDGQVGDWLINKSIKLIQTVQYNPCDLLSSGDPMRSAAGASRLYITALSILITPTSTISAVEMS